MKDLRDLKDLTINDVQPIAPERPPSVTTRPPRMPGATSSKSASALKFIRRLQVVHRVSSSLLGHVVPLFRAFSGRLNFT